MSSLMNFQIFRSRKLFSTTGERANEGFFSRMYPNVIDQFVFRFESSSIPTATVPIARVVRIFWNKE